MRPNPLAILSVVGVSQRCPSFFRLSWEMAPTKPGSHFSEPPRPQVVTRWGEDEDVMLTMLTGTNLDVQEGEEPIKRHCWGFCRLLPHSQPLPPQTHKTKYRPELNVCKVTRPSEQDRRAQSKIPCGNTSLSEAVVIFRQYYVPRIIVGAFPRIIS